MVVCGGVLVVMVALVEVVVGAKLGCGEGGAEDDELGGGGLGRDRSWGHGGGGVSCGGVNAGSRGLCRG